MSLPQRVKKQSQDLYGELNAEMNKKKDIRLTLQSDDAKLLKQFKEGTISTDKVDELLITAHEFDNELKDFIEKNNLRKKVAANKQRIIRRSGMPPIWNDAKLNKYIESIVEEVFESCDNEDETARSASQVPLKPILKQKSLTQSKRNVSTNVKFQIQPEKVQTMKQTNKKVQVIDPPISRLHKSRSSEGQSSRMTNKDGSVDVTFPTGFKIPSDQRSLPIQILNISPLTITSTGKQNKHESQFSKSDDVVDVVDCNLAANHIGKAKQMTKQLMPVMSIKSACCIQKIYQLEVAPSTQTRRDDSTIEPANSKVVQCVYEPQSEINPSTEPLASIANPAITFENAEPTSFLDVRALNSVLNECGVHLRDGKIHVVVEDSRKWRSNKKRKTRKSLKPSTAALGRSVDKFKAATRKTADNETERINICSFSEPFEKEEDKANEKDSSMSSSITDDGKIRQILNINRVVARRERDTSPDSYPTSSANGESSFQPIDPPNHEQHSVSSNFQSIYKLIEDTFETNVGKDVTPETVESVKEIDSGMKEMRKIIKMSEENMKQATRLLQKYQTPSERVTDSQAGRELEAFRDSDEKIEVAKSHQKQLCHREVQTCSELDEIVKAVSSSDKQDEVKISQSVDFCVQTSDDKNVQTDENLSWKSQDYFGSIFEAYSNFKHIKFNQPPTPSSQRHDPVCSMLNSCTCFGCETDRHLNRVSNSRPMVNMSPSRPLMKPLTSFNSASTFPVPFNRMYEGDDEVMEAANKFLRSVEKQKQRNISRSSSSSESRSFSPQKVHSIRSSSSISTSSSSLISNVKENRAHFDQTVASRTRIRLGDKLEEAANRIASVEEKLDPPSGDTNSRHLSSNFRTASPSDSDDIDAFLERYMSEGEVLSQGEVQLGLSDDDEADVDF